MARLPKQVRLRYEQYKIEGESERAARYHAVENSYACDDITEAQADRLDQWVAEARQGSVS